MPGQERIGRQGGEGEIEVQCGEFSGPQTAGSAAQAVQRDAGMRAPADPALNGAARARTRPPRSF